MSSSIDHVSLLRRNVISEMKEISNSLKTDVLLSIFEFKLTINSSCKSSLRRSNTSLSSSLNYLLLDYKI
jgi:hypothetical protein